METNRFWNTIKENFHSVLGVDPYRSKHQVTAKWKDMNTKLAKFARIFNNRSNQGSEESGDVIFKRSLEEYRVMSNEHSFTHFKAWDIVQDSIRWIDVPDNQHSKRARTSDEGGSSDKRCFADHNLFDDEAPELALLIEKDRSGKAWS
ncbi:hypothetical protein LXL04_022671 [Taraxacum kok-saghyz]